MIITYYTQDGYSYPVITVKNGFSVGYQKVKKLEDAIKIAEQFKFRF